VMADDDQHHLFAASELEQHQSRLLCEALTGADLRTGELWLRYFGIGGLVDEYEVDAYIHSALSLPPLERDLLAQAANELIDELPPPPRAPYLEDLRQVDGWPSRRRA
jgi:hypothetical protein